MCACAGLQASEEDARPRGAPDTNPPSTSGRPSDPNSPSLSPNHKHEEDVLRVKEQGFHVAHTVLHLSALVSTGQLTDQSVPVSLHGATPLTQTPAHCYPTHPPPGPAATRV